MWQGEVSSSLYDVDVYGEHLSIGQETDLSQITVRKTPTD